MADTNIDVNPQNSPYTIQAGTQNFGTVKIEPGGFLQLAQQTNLGIKTLNKTTATKLTSSFTEKR